MRTILAICLALMATTAIAGDTYRFDRGVVAVGDSTGALIQRAGQPDRIVDQQNKLGAVIAERWEYYLRDKQVSFTIAGGRIVKIDEAR